MELYYLFVSVILTLVNIFHKVTIASKLEHRIMYVLCLMLLIYPVVTQLSSRRIKKTILIWLIVLVGIAGFTGISASLFIPVSEQCLVINWGLFLASLALQNCNIFYHSFLFLKYNSGRIQSRTYKFGLIAIMTGLIVSFAAIYPLKYDLYIYSAIGIIGHIIALLGCLIMRKSSSRPQSNIA